MRLRFRPIHSILSREKQHPSIGRNAYESHRAYDLDNGIMIEHKTSGNVCLKYTDILHVGYADAEYGMRQEILNSELYELKARFVSDGGVFNTRGVKLRQKTR